MTNKTRPYRELLLERLANLKWLDTILMLLSKTLRKLS